MQLSSVPGRPPEEPADECRELYATSKWGPHYCACGAVNICRIEKGAATYKVCGETDTVVWIGEPIDRASGNKVVKRTKQPTRKVGDKYSSDSSTQPDGHEDGEFGLSALVAEFRATGYPSDDDHQHEAARAGFEQTLRSLREIAYGGREAVKAVWNPAEFDYGSVGYAGAGANRLVNNASAQDWPQIRGELAEVCFGSDDEATRLDRAAASGVLSGVRYVTGTRLLAICQPHDIVPIYLLRKSRKYPGVIDMIELLDRLDLIGENDRHGAQELASLSDADLSSGAVVMQANDLLLETLRPHFSDGGDVDTWEMSKFLYWLMEQHPADGETDEPRIDEADLAVLAEDLLCDVQFVKDIVSLLEDKGQVILYGPPGTGKTFFAQRLARALIAGGRTTGAADEDWMQRLDLYCLHLEQHQRVQSGPHRSIAKRWIEFTLERGLDPSVWDESVYTQFANLSPNWKDITRKTHRSDLRRWCSWASASGGDGRRHDGTVSLVQFHPAYSYEDFFEGFRPQVDDNGQMTYQLTPGPLVRLAERAEQHFDELHVMVIDEINRANLPRVLGELLFLLEYRDRSIHTQYRPETQFSLPKNLWFIGTMNTADRSIALIDAAMRRRFHFVPFFPDREPTAGLLRRWCEQNEQETWIADLLDGVNERLRGDLGGDHMLIGPSHFMKEDLDEDGLRRIWEYNIEPLIEDQFFGRQDVINSYRFDEIWRRHGPGAAASEAGPGTPDGPVDDDESQSARDEGAESSGDE